MIAGASRVEGAAAVLLGCIAVAMIVAQATTLVARLDEATSLLGIDYQMSMAGARQWLAGGSFYFAHQLAGPYDVVGWNIQYPPTALLLYVPMAFLPAPAWWIIPVAITAAAIWRHRPRPIAWGVIAFILANPTVHSMLWFGNPGLWVVAALAIATHRGWAGPLVLFKPTLLPFALVGISRRPWWVGLAILILVSVPFAGLWADYVVVLTNATGASGPARYLYSLPQVPAMLLPIAAWLGRRPRGLPAAVVRPQVRPADRARRLVPPGLARRLHWSDAPDPDEGIHAKPHWVAGSSLPNGG